MLGLVVQLVDHITEQTMATSQYQARQHEEPLFSSAQMSKTFSIQPFIRYKDELKGPTEVQATLRLTIRGEGSRQEDNHCSTPLQNCLDSLFLVKRSPIAGALKDNPPAKTTMSSSPIASYFHLKPSHYDSVQEMEPDRPWEDFNKPSIWNAPAKIGRRGPLHLLRL